MNRLLFPQEVYTGPDALANVFNRDYASILLLSDMATPQTARVTQKLLHTFNSMLTETTLITAPDAPRLFAQAYAYANVEMPECLLAVGSGFVQDCAAAVAHAVPLPYVAVPTAAPTQLTDCDTLDPFLYRTPPAVCILDPVFITAQDSQQLAYEAAKEKSARSYRSKQQRSADAARKNEMRRLEKEIDQLQAEIDALTEEISREEVYSDYELMAEKCSEIDSLKQRIEEDFELLIELEG